MPRTSIYVLASLVSGVSAALILASGSGYAEARFPQGTAHHLRAGRSTCHGGGDGCWTSPYQIANLNSAEDFCLWAPSQPALSVTEHALVAWCLKGAHSTRLIPDGVILGARLLITPEYVQITGVGNLSRINVPSGGTASASGDRSHGLVVTNAYGQLEQIQHWTSFVSQDRFCFRACMPSAVASTTCPPVSDVFGCADDAPGSYDVGTFEDCVGDAIKAPSTLFQGILAASSHDTAHTFSSCTIRRVVGDARVPHARRTIACTSDCTDTSSTFSPVPTTTDNATFPSLPTSTSSTAYTNSDTPASSAPPVSTAYPSNNTCTFYSHPHRHPHHHSSASFDSLSPSPSPSSSSSNVSFSSSGCWGAAPSDLPLTSFASSPTWSTPPFTPGVPAYSSSDPLSFGTSSSVTPSDPAPTFTSSTPTYDSSDPLPVVTSLTPPPTSTSTSYLSSSSYDSSSLPPSSFSSSSLSDSIASPPSSLASPPPTLSSSTSPTLSLTSISSPSESSPSSSPASSQTPWVPTLTSSDPTTSSDSSQSPTSTLSSLPPPSPSPQPPSLSSSTPSSVSTFLPGPSSTLPNSQTQLGSQCPPPSLAAAGNGAGRSVAPQTPFLFSLTLVILTIVSLSSVGVLVL